MAQRIVWSPEAVEDLGSISEYIGKDSEFYARAVVTKIIESIEYLPSMPHLGRVVPEIDKPEIRELIVYNYRLVYCTDNKRILVTAIIHGKRRISSIAERLSEK
jgi:toxin ParE1/3/4